MVSGSNRTRVPTITQAHIHKNNMCTAYMYIYIYIYICMHISIYIYVCMYVRMYACMPVCAYVCMHVRLCVITLALDHISLYCTLLYSTIRTIFTFVDIRVHLFMC